MAHGITQEDKVLLRQDAWHKLGWVKGDYITRQDINERGLCFKLQKHQLDHPFIHGKKINSWGLFHEDGTFVANCGENYAIHTPEVIFDTMDELIGSQEGAKYETAGIIGDYHKVWGLVDIRASIRVGNDEIEQYLMGCTTFDSTGSTKFLQTNTRVVCQNTWNAALSGKINKMLSVRHTAKSHRRLNDARQAMAGIQAEFLTMSERLNFLASRYIKPIDIKNILDEIVSQPSDSSDTNTNRMQNCRRDNILNEIIAIYEYNDDNAFPEQRGTAYNMFNAITNYVDHNRSTRTKDGQSAEYNRALSSISGSGAKMKEKAFEVILEMANGMSSKPVRQIVTTGIDTPGDSLLDEIIAGV